MLPAAACSGKKEAVVAPIFEQGKGSAIPDETEQPLYLLSDREAMDIIKDEAAKAGLELESFGSDDGDTYMVNAVTSVSTITKDGGSEYTECITLGTAVELEALDREKKIAVSFISGAESEYGKSSNTFYFMESRALDAASSWAGKDAPYVIGVFYDPGAVYSDENIMSLWVDYMYGAEDQKEESKTKYDEAVKACLEENLRAQVDDFTDWLKDQGII